MQKQIAFWCGAYDSDSVPVVFFIICYIFQHTGKCNGPGIGDIIKAGKRVCRVLHVFSQYAGIFNRGFRI